MNRLSNTAIVDFTIETLRSGPTIHSVELTLKFEDGSEWTGRVHPATGGKVVNFDIRTRRQDTLAQHAGAECRSSSIV